MPRYFWRGVASCENAVKYQLDMALFSGKYSSPSLFRAEMLVGDSGAFKHLREVKCPATVILFLVGSPLNMTAHQMGKTHRVLSGKLAILDGERAVFSDFGIGAPSLVFHMEILRALGARRFISVGTCGAFGAGLSAGDVVVVEKSLRDEGTSSHYVPPSEFSHANSKLTNEVFDLLSAGSPKFRLQRGVSWTTDAPFRETAADIDGCLAKGVSVVDMEASALFSVARFYDLPAASVFVVSDVFAAEEAELGGGDDGEGSEREGGKSWKPHFSLAKPVLDQVLRLLLRI